MKTAPAAGLILVPQLTMNGPTRSVAAPPSGPTPVSRSLLRRSPLLAWAQPVAGAHRDEPEARLAGEMDRASISFWMAVEERME